MHSTQSTRSSARSLRITITTLLSVAAVATAVAAKPDLSGPWEVTAAVNTLKTTDGKTPPLTAAGQQLYQKNKANPDSDPIKDCLPPGIPRALMQKGFPFSIVIGEKIGGMVLEWNHLPRPIYMDQAHFENIGPTYLGQSVGKWDGDTLVIDTNGFNDKTWLDGSGLPHSEDLHIVERLRLKNATTLEDTLTFEDSTVFSKAWSTVVTFTKRPGYIIKEDYCFGRTGQGTTVSK